MPSVWNLGDDSPASMIGGVGWYRKDFTVPEASKALEWAVRFESVNYRSRVWLNGKRVGSNARRLPPVRAPAQGHQAPGHEPAGDPRRLPAPRHRLPARRPHRRRPADRRLVELLGHAARGLPQAPQPGGLEGRAGDPRLRAPARLRAGQGHRAEREGERPSASASPAASARSGSTSAAAASPADGTRSFTTTIRVPQREAVDAVAALPLPGEAHGLGGRPRGQQLPAADRHPDGPRRRRRPPAAQRQAPEPARRRRARGVQGAGLRGRQRVPHAGSCPRSRRWARR